MRDEKQLVLDFMKSHKLAVLATASSSAIPEASAVGISVMDNMEVLFGTFNTSRKWENLQKNARVSLVIGWEHGKTVQYEGVAEELMENEKDEALKIHFANVPSFAKYVSDKEAVIYRIKPESIKYSDHSCDPADVIKLSF